MDIKATETRYAAAEADYAADTRPQARIHKAIIVQNAWNALVVAHDEVSRCQSATEDPRWKIAEANLRAHRALNEAQGTFAETRNLLS